MRALFLSLLFGVFIVSGCKSGKVCDARGEFDQCEIHHRIMRSEKYSNPHRTTPPSQEYLAARTRYFRHAKPVLFGLPDDCKSCMVYICEDCDRLEKQFRAANPGLAP